MNKTFGVINAIVLMAMVSGCSHAPLGKEFNLANANNIAVQTVNPTAGSTEPEVATLDGQKSEHLLQRYRADSGKASTETLVTKLAK